MKDRNGREIQKGSRVFWTNPARYQSNGDYIVADIFAGVVQLKHLDGAKPNYDMADGKDLSIYA